MKKLLIACIALCVNYAVAQENRTETLDNFRNIKVFDGISVNIIKAKENKAVISGDDIDKVALIIKNGTLKIRMRTNKIYSGHETMIELYYAQKLQVIDVNEDAFLSSQDIIEQTSIELRAQEGAEIELSIDTQKVNITSTSGGKITAKGESIIQDVVISSGGEYEGDQMLSEQTTVAVNAGGTAYVNASELVEAKVRAGGTVRIHGDPKVIDKKTFLGGRIIEMK